MDMPRDWSERRVEVPSCADLPVREGERRQHARLYAPFPVDIRGLTATGEAFHVLAVLDNLSAGGFYVRLQYRLVVGVRVFAVIELAAGQTPTTLRVAVRGHVVRTALYPDGRCGVGVQFMRHRFL